MLNGLARDAEAAGLQMMPVHTAGVRSLPSIIVPEPGKVMPCTPCAEERGFLFHLAAEHGPSIHQDAEQQDRQQIFFDGCLFPPHHTPGVEKHPPHGRVFFSLALPMLAPMGEKREPY